MNGSPQKESDPVFMPNVRTLRLPAVTNRSYVMDFPQGASGTVAASVEHATGNYGDGSQSLSASGPMRHAAPTPAPSGQSRAKDLVAELDSINAQIHRIMSQVERAVARLATSG